MSLTINLNEDQIHDKVRNKKLGLFVANEWKRLINPYTPREKGTLLQTAKVRPWEIEYIQPYSHYMYEGILYIDPSTGSAWAGFGVDKVPTDKNLNYQKVNPFATDHWDKKAAKAGQQNKLYRTINAGLASGRF